MKNLNIGIYKITNIKNNKFYIGSTILGFKKRWKKHVLDLENNKHHSCVLQRSWNKYGRENFKFEILEVCNKTKCLIREQYYINKLHPEYNMCKIAGSTTGFKFPLDYCKNLIKLRKGKNNPFYGKKHSKETKQILREINIGKWEGKKNPKYNKGFLIKGKNNPFYGKKHSKETKQIISCKNKGKRLSFNHPNFSGFFEFFHTDYGKRICGMCDLTREFNLIGSHVWSICHGKRKSHRGWICLGKIN